MSGIVVILVRTVGLSDYRTAGLSDYWIAGLPDKISA